MRTEAITLLIQAEKPPTLLLSYLADVFFCFRDLEDRPAAFLGGVDPARVSWL